MPDDHQPAPQPERWLVLPDEHWPAADKASIRAVEAYMAAHRWDGVVSLGDFLDLDMISRWVENAPRKIEHKRVKYAVDIGRMVLEKRINVLRLGPNGNPKCRYIMIEGNHCNRFEQEIDKRPVWEGLIGFKECLGIDELRIEWVPFWSDPRQVFRKGKATFIHGLYTNQYHAAKHVRQFGTNVIYGHSHTVQEHALVFGANTNAITGKSLGHLTDPKQMDYIRGKPQDWCQAFSTFLFWPNGNFNEYTTKIFNHAFFGPDERYYDGAAIAEGHLDKMFIS